MKTIVYKLLCVCLFILLIQFGAGYLVREYIDGDFQYSKAMNRKIALLKQAASPKIIVIGGSNTVFGIECRRLAESTDYRVVNLGFNINIGIRFGMEILSPYLAKGDIVLVSPEYENFFSDNIYYGDGTVAFLAAKNIKSLSSYYLSSCQQLSSIFGRLPYIAFNHFYTHDFLGKSTVAELNHDEFGDMQIDDIAFSGIPFDEKKVIASQLVFNDIVIKDLVQFQKLAVAKGARLIIAYPFIPEETYKLNRIKLYDLHNKLQSAGLEIMAPPSESFAAKVYFRDMSYHPNPIGRILRTDAIIHGIKLLKN